MMEASKAAEDDLRELLASLKKTSAEREKLPPAMGKMKGTKKASAPAYLKKVTTLKTSNLQIAYSAAPDASAAECESKDAEACVDELRQKQEALSEVSEPITTKLQSLMERRQRMINMLTKMMKKVSETPDPAIAALGQSQYP